MTEEIVTKVIATDEGLKEVTGYHRQEGGFEILSPENLSKIGQYLKDNKVLSKLQTDEFQKEIDAEPLIVNPDAIVTETGCTACKKPIKRAQMWKHVKTQGHLKNSVITVEQKLDHIIKIIGKVHKSLENFQK